MSSLPLLLFDCDGVLVDSEPLATQVLQSSLQEHGWPITEEDVDRLFRGKSLRDCVRLIEEKIERSLPVDFIERLNARTFSAFEGQLQAVTGVREALLELRAHGHTIGVASSGSYEKMRFTLGLTGLLPLLESSLFSAQDVTRGKPAPDLFLHAAAQLGRSPSETIVIEDSVPGVLGARAAGMRVFGYAGAGNSTELLAAGAHPFDSMSALPALITASSHAEPS